MVCSCGMVSNRLLCACNMTVVLQFGVTCVGIERRALSFHWVGVVRFGRMLAKRALEAFDDVSKFALMSIVQELSRVQRSCIKRNFC